MGLNHDDYIILKGDERISFNQNVFRIVTNRLRSLVNKEIYTDLDNLKIRDANVLYELKFKEGYKYNADFDIDINIKWDYHCLNIPSGILKHVNSGDKHFVHLDGDSFQTFNRILLSQDKVVYENKEECIKEFIENHEGHVFNMCIADPDRSKTHPSDPIFSLI